MTVPEGTASSSVRVVAYEDLQCPDCAVYRKMMDEVLLPRYGDRVAFEHRDFPPPGRTWARQGAIAGRYLEGVAPSLGVAYRRRVFGRLAEITLENFVADISSFAKSHHIAFDPAILDEPNWNQAVEQDYQDGLAKGVRRTPTVFVNSHVFVETFTVEDLVKHIDIELRDKV